MFRRVAIPVILIGAVVAASVVLLTASNERAPSQATPTSIDADAVRLELGDSFQQIVTSHPPGTHFVIASGVHRLQEVHPKDGQIFTGEPGAVMSGARVLTSFSREGGWWVVTGQTQQGPVHPEAARYQIMLPGYEQEDHPEDVFMDGRRLRHVAGLSQVEPGKWFFDYAADKIYLADDPGGHLVETSVAAHAFFGPGVRDVVIENLAVRHYATPSQTGAIQANGTKNWTIRYVDASSNHALGIMAGPGTSLHHSRMNYNGQMGLRGESIDPDTGFDAPMIIEHNEIAHNHELGYNWMWEAGGLKILGSTGTVFRQNWVHDNAGPGIWFDGFNRATTIDSNLVENNTHIGIFYEISYGPTKIRWNIVRNNGAGQPGGLGAGILVMNSREVTVTGNAVDANQSGIIAVMADRELGPDGQLETTNVKVIGNDIRMLSGVSGLVDETSNDAYYTSKGNVFDENTYRVESPIARYFCWMGCWEEPSDWADWRSAGNDSAGQLLQANDEPILSDDALPFELVGYGPLS